MSRALYNLVTPLLCQYHYGNEHDAWQQNLQNTPGKRRNRPRLNSLVNSSGGAEEQINKQKKREITNITATALGFLVKVK